MGRKISNVLPLALIIVLGIALIVISAILVVNSVSPASSIPAIPNLQPPASPLLIDEPIP